MRNRGLEQHSESGRYGRMPDSLQTEIEQALRTGNPDDAARVIMNHKQCSLDDARKEVHKILAAKRKS